MGDRSSTHIRIGKDVKLSMDEKKGKGTYDEFLKKLMNVNKNVNRGMNK